MKSTVMVKPEPIAPIFISNKTHRRQHSLTNIETRYEDGRDFIAVSRYLKKSENNRVIWNSITEQIAFKSGGKYHVTSENCCENSFFY